MRARVTSEFLTCCSFFITISGIRKLEIIGIIGMRDTCSGPDAKGS
jgi:hypothetical protein